MTDDEYYKKCRKELATPDAEYFTAAWNSVAINLTSTYIRVFHQNETYGEFVADYTFIFPKNQAMILWKILDFIKAKIKPFKGTSLEFSFPDKIKDPEIIIKNMSIEQRHVLVKTLNHAGLTYKGNEVSFYPDTDGEL